MTKQQLRESIRRVIKQELDEAKIIGKTKSGKDIYLDFNNPAHKNFTAADHDDASQVLLIGKSSASISPARKAAAKQHFLASKAKQQLRETIRRIINQELSEGPAVADPDTEEDVETTPYISPDEDDDDLTIGNPNVKPNPQAEKNIIKKIMARYAASLNEKKYK
jgi:hypothetical protein